MRPGRLVTLWVSEAEALTAGLDHVAPMDPARLTYGLTTVGAVIQHVATLTATSGVANPTRVTVGAVHRDDDRCVHGQSRDGWCEGCQVDFLGEG